MNRTDLIAGRHHRLLERCMTFMNEPVEGQTAADAIGMEGE